MVQAPRAPVIPYIRKTKLPFEQRRVVEPFVCYQYDAVSKSYNMQAPNDLLERDVLYCASLVSNRLGDKEPVDKIEKLVILVADQYMNHFYSEKVAYDVLMKILSNLPCIPETIFQNYIFNMNNENMPISMFENPIEEAKIRLNIMKKGFVKICASKSFDHPNMNKFYSYDNPEIFLKHLQELENGISYMAHPSYVVCITFCYILIMFWKSAILSFYAGSKSTRKTCISKGSMGSNQWI